MIVSGRRKNHDSFWIIDGQDGKVKDQCYEVVMKLRESTRWQKWGSKATISYRIEQIVMATFVRSYDTHFWVELRKKSTYKV